MAGEEEKRAGLGAVGRRTLKHVISNIMTIVNNKRKAMVICPSLRAQPSGAMNTHSTQELSGEKALQNA